MIANLKAGDHLHRKWRRGEETQHNGTRYLELTRLFDQFCEWAEKNRKPAERLLGASVHSFYVKVRDEQATLGRRRVAEAARAKKPKRGQLDGQDDDLVKDVYRADRRQYQAVKGQRSHGDKKRAQQAVRESRAANPNAYKFLG